MNNWTEYIKDSWIKNQIDPDMVSWSQRFGAYLSEPHENKKNTEMTTSQLRKFFGELKKQQARGWDEPEFLLLKPKLAYAVGRAKNKFAKIHDFYHVMAGAMGHVKNEEQFKRFIKIFEAVVAYHKAAEDSKLN